LLVGTGVDEEKIKNKVHQLKIENNVRFLGVRNDVNELMQAMDEFLFPSLFEGLPVTLIEAQASDLYIFASNTISKNVKLIDKFEFLSIDESPKYWAKTIHNKSKNTEKRVNRSKEIKLANFDIIVEAKKIQDFFERN
jgi:glycosyltransferase involved in cell wall biosynthesis